ncbi:SpaA isopeptide-forming pilin-related protein [Vagococcus lutrae]|uniref:SpaA isopeptide-forming pilin-related protein n=1 Tax=Vagococcus lutrae TaxID=81947 RepID=UPI00288C6BD0|nr:SpaA isopeptide-forming pilin-related protein [Vagococcus lutrae]MDT2806392.1 SpaA isopeptide-forming pilin-related protein [Vagococcus lutrae]
MKIQGKMNGNNLRLTLSEPFNVSNQEIVVSNSKGELIGQAQAAKQQITLNVENIEDFVDDIVFEVPVKYQPLEEKQQEVLTLHGVETRLPLNVKLQSQNNTAKEEANKEDDVSDSDDDAAPEAEEKETEEDLPEWVEILTDEMLEISEVDLTYEEPTSLSSNFMFSFNWKIKEKYKGKIKNGTKYEFDLPNEFVINPDTTAEGNLGDLGRYQVVGKKVVFTFNDSVENLENIEGDFKLSLKIDREVITTNDEIVIKNPFSDTEIGKITIESELPKGIEKEGTFDQNTNPTQINWEIIVNKRHDMLDGLVIEEHIAEDQEIDWDSLEIVEQKYDLDGNLLENGIVVSKEDYDIENNQIIFKNSSKKAYKIKFVAKIKENADYEKNGTHTFKNNVIQKSKNSEPLSKDAQVTATFEKRLTKNLLTHDKVEQTIKWEIDFNKGKNKLPSDKAYIKDSLSSKSGKAIYDEGSFIIKDVETEETLKEGKDYELIFTKSEGQEAFELKFKEEPFERHVKIEYQTKYEEGYIVDKEDKVSNKAETDNGSGEGEVVNNQQNIVKTGMGVDYENKHLKWQITINKQKLKMSDVEINDKFDTSGMLLLNDTLVIKDVEGNELPNTEYTITKSDSTGFKIKFEREVQKELIINFSTSFERTEKREEIFKNESSITWTTNGKKYTSESGAEQKLNNEFQHNGKKIGKYDAKNKKINWEIWLNYNNEDIPALTVSDIIEGNQKLIEDSKELYQGKMEGREKEELKADGEAIQDYTFKYDEESKTFTLEKDLKNQTNKRYVFKYSTSLKDEVVKEEYKNRATVKYGNDREDELTESVKPDNGGKFVYKKGERIEDGKEKLKWDITLNPSGSYIKDFKLVDRPSTNHMILEDTIRIKGLTKGVDYTQSLTTDFETGQQTLEIEFLIIIKKEYTLTYDTEVLLLGEGKNVFGNQIEVTGSNDKIKQVEKSKEIEVQHVTSGGSATGTNTDLKIIKEDNTNSQKPVNLKGIEFDLLNEKGRKIREITTDTQGEAVIKGIITGTYFLKEKNLPEGYLQSELTGDKGQKIVVRKNNENTIPTIKVYNTKNIFTLTKVDEKGNAIKSGETTFSLSKDGVDLREVKTDESGKLVLRGLEKGNYELVETTAPTGYIKNPTPIKFKVTGEETEEVLLGENGKWTNYQGSVFLQKEDIHGTPLEGAEFGLFDKKTGKIIDKVTSDSKGKVSFSGIAPGEYYIQETKAAPGYLLNDQKVRFTVTNTSEKKITPKDLGVVKNYRGSMTLTKTNEAKEKLAGATFIIERQLPQNKWEQIDEERTTNKEGVVTFSDLAPGVYRLVEVSAPTGYVKNTEPVEFEVKDGVAKDVVQYAKEMTNYQGSVQLIKEDDLGHGLANAEFTLFNENDEVVHENIVSNKQGIVSVKDLAPGNYYFKEVKAPEGYQLNTTPIEFTIAAEAKGKPDVLKVSESFINYQGKFTLEKKDEKGQALKGAEFVLYQKGKSTPYRKDLVTNQEGKIVLDNLPVGDYELKEVSAPTGYITNTEVIAFEITPEATEKQQIEDSFINYQGSAKLQKVNEASEGLAGAKFDVYLEDKVTPIETGLESDEDGNVIVRDLAPGTYYFKETQAPTGYQLNDTPIAFTIEKEAKGEPVVVDAGQLTNYQGKVVLTKVNEAKDALANAIFSLYTEAGEEVAKDLTTDENGQLTVDHLAPGKYYFEETQAPTGYLLNQEKLAFEITEKSAEKEVVAVTFTNYQGSAKLQKVNQLGEALADAVFEVVDEAGTVVADNLVSNEQGEVVVTGLAPGVYHFKETQAPVGYKLNESLSAPFEIPNEATGILPTVEVGNFVNYQGHVTLTKIDDKKRTLEGAVFELFNAKFDEKAVVTGLRSNESGTIEVGNLPVGDYYLREVVAAPGHILNTEEIHFTISDTGSEMEEYQFNFYNYQGSAKLQKVNEAGEGLAGAKFDVYLEDKVTPIATGLESDEDGNVIVRDLAPGTYYFKETQAPTGYQLNDTPIAFTIEKEAKGEPVVLDAGQLTNYQGKVVLAKVNEANDALANAVFSLYTEAGEEVAKDLTTDENGQLTVDHLAPGKYYFEETQAPTGYLLNQEKLAFEITEKSAEKEVVEVAFTNYQGSALLVKRDGRTNQTLAKATFELRRADNTLVEGYEQVLTNEHGELLLDALAPGSYQLIETQAPTGYQLDKTPVTFTVQAAEKGQPKRIELEKINHRIPEVTKDKPNKPSFLPQTNEIQSSAWLIVGLGFMAVSGYGYYRRYNR